MTDDEAMALGYAYKVMSTKGYVYAHTAAEANLIQRSLHSHFNEAPEVELLRREPDTVEDIVAMVVCCV